MDQSQDHRWSSLPEEIWELIMSRLHKGDEVIFRFVCKTWRKLPKPKPQVLRLPDFDDIDTSSSPWLMSFPGWPWNNGTCKIFNPINNTTYHSMFPELRESKILFAKYGWWLMLEGDDKLSLFQVSMEKMILLPSCPDYFDFMSFTCSPESPNCLLVSIWVVDSSLRIYIHKLGGDEKGWQEYNPVLPDDWGSGTTNCVPSFHNGKYYCFEERGNLFTFDPEDVEASFRYFDDGYGRFDKRPMSLAYRIYTVENEGDLLVIFITEYAQNVYVYKWDGSDDTFKSVESLGDNNLFISMGAAFSKKALVKGTGNRIYFPTFFLDKGRTGPYAFYSLATKKYQSFSNRFSQAHPFPLAELPTSIWFSLDF